MRGNRGVIGKFKQNTDFGGRLGSQEAYLLSAGGFYPRFAAASSGTLISDSSHTVFLAKASGNDGTNTSVTDTSDYTQDITNNNARTQGFTPYHPGGYSVEFNGVNSQLTAAHSTDFNIYGNVDGFTIEGWIYPRSYHSSSYGDGIVCKNSGSTGWIVRLGTSAAPKLQFVHPGVAGSGPVGNNVPLDEWTHFAFTRADDGSFKLYQNGILTESFTLSGSNQNTSETLFIGYESSQSTSRFDGYIKDVRISNTIVYTANFTPPTESLTSTTNTKFLACHAPFIRDGSSSAHTITSSNASNKRFAPYDIADGSEYSVSSHGASVYFDGSGDNLSVAHDDTLNFGTDDWTVEQWIYKKGSFKNYDTLWSKYSNPNGYFFHISSTGAVLFGVSNSGYATSTETLSLNTWHHIATVKNSNTIRVYIDGKATSIAYSHSSSNDISTPFLVGAINGISRDFEGYMSDLRVVKGTAVYNGNFTPPSGALTTTGGRYTNSTNRTNPSASATRLLTCNTQPSLYDIGTGLRSILYGNSNASTDQAKYGSSSIHFDGSSDYIDFDANENLDLGTNPMTMEAWFKTGSTTDDTYFRRIVMLDGPTLNSASNPQLMIDSTTENHGVAFAVGGGLDIRDTVTGITVNDNNWHHIALTRNNTNAQLFIDGTYAGNQVIGTQAFSPNSGAPRVRLGNYNGSSGQGDWNGYVQDVRISNGVCRYPFVPAAETLTSGTLTKALACHADSETTAVYGADSEELSVTKTGNVSVSDFGPGPGMKSCYFDGSGDYLYDIDLGSAIGTDDFCIEGWAYRHPSSGTSARAIFQISDDNVDGLTSSGSYLSLGIRNNSFGNEWQGNGTINVTDTDTELDRWYHFAYQRNGGNINIFIGGQMISSTSNTTNYSTARYLTVGGYFSTSYLWYGYISNLRVSVGSGSNFYANSFTVPAAELTS